MTITTLLARAYDWRDAIEHFITPVIGAGDIKAAFDNAEVKTFIAALRARKTHPRLISAMLVEMLSLQVQPSSEQLEFTSWVPWTKCIRQGGVESTFSWNLFFGWFMSMLHPAWCSRGFGIAVSSSVTVTHLLWSDNLYITAKNIGEWQIMFTQLTNLVTSHGLQWKENSVIVLEGGIDYDELLDVARGHRTLELEPIGTIIQQDGGDEKRINRALRKTNGAFWAQSPVLFSPSISVGKHVLRG